MKNLRKFVFLLAITSCTSSVLAQNACLNVALDKPTTASESTTEEVASRATDGDLSTNWCTPGFTGWIKIDLQHKFAVDSIKLYVNQANSGNTVHEIKVSNDLENWTLVETLADFTENNQILKIKFTPALSNVRGVMVNTTTSNSWVSWYEIEVYATLSQPTVSQNGNVLTSSSTVNNQWYLNGEPIPGATSQTFTMTVPGSYQVGVTNGTGCAEAMSEIVSLITELNGFETNRIKILPNPAKDNLIVEGVSKGIIEILNLERQMIKQVNVSDLKTNIDISNLTSGFYSLRITTAEGTIVKKLLKQ